ncbi:LLM class flavin-dependent oxidoreductase [Herbiconiux moechotypicola]|uniref:LLM class flavin-dependent oxidoreductase n=1 Tax=Herbiconiux moechotypicola TaxID=637393 RepID=UPI00217E3F6F|nr:LLM class flavin-dependent oxidoreductase [Herbiconiux moechotypicola]MCS5728181.1 LLM class flavin-dependent oxidoreductase [Herbiconiux moechotypicola]
MQKPGAGIPLSVLDLVLIPEGGTPASALADAVTLARAADRAGYQRYWVAEHHLYPGGAGAASYLLLPTVAAATTRIRVGTAVIVIDNHAPLQVAEIGGTVAALAGRGVDLGVGRGGPSEAQRAAARAVNDRLAVGELEPGPVGESELVDGVVVPPRVVVPFNDVRAGLNDRLLSRTPGAPADFGEQIAEVLGFLRGGFEVPEGVEVVATPAEGADVDLWVHGSSAGVSAQVAGRNGLRFGANYHSLPQSVFATVAAYREAFVPSAQLDRPYVAVSADVVVAETDEEAARIAEPFGLWLYRSRTEYAAPLYPSAATAAAHPLTESQRAQVSDRLASRIVGSPATVVRRLAALAAATGADELVVTTQAHALADRIRSYELLAEAWD